MLSRGWIINAVLVILIAGLVAFAWLQPDSAPDQAFERISDRPIDEIERVEIDYGPSVIQLERTDTGWMLQSPVSWPAEATNVRRLLNIMANEIPPLAAAGDVDLENLGLLQPVASLRMDDIELRFGATNNIGERRYLMVDQRIYLMPDVHLAFIAQGLSGLVGRQLLPLPFRIDSIKLPGLSVEKNQDKQWHSSSDTKFSESQLQALVDNWQQLQATRVTPFDLGGSARDVIEIRLENGATIDFIVMSRQPELVIANPSIDLQFHFIREYGDQLLEVPATDTAIETSGDS